MAPISPDDGTTFPIGQLKREKWLRAFALEGHLRGVFCIEVAQDLHEILDYEVVLKREASTTSFCIFGAHTDYSKRDGTIRQQDLK